MPEPLRVTDVRFVRVRPRDGSPDQGLVGWVSLRLNGRLGLDGIAVRRTRSGVLALSFPRRVDSRGRAHPFVYPVDDEARVALEEQILSAIAAEVPS